MHCLNMGKTMEGFLSAYILASPAGGIGKGGGGPLKDVVFFSKHMFSKILKRNVKKINKKGKLFIA